MPLLRRPVQGIDDRRPDALRGIFSQTHLPGNLIGRLEADPEDLFGQPVGIFLDLFYNLRAVMAIKAQRLAQTDAVALQKNKDILQFAISPEAGQDLGGFLGPDPFHFLQPFRLLLHDLQGFQSQALDNPRRGNRADTLNQARSQVAL